MAEIYLRHDVHGVKIATLELEAEADEENGWERFDPDEVPKPVGNAIFQRRRGRPRQDLDDDNHSSRHNL